MIVEYSYMTIQIIIILIIILFNHSAFKVSFLHEMNVNLQIHTSYRITNIVLTLIFLFQNVYIYNKKTFKKE